jgi:uncharacterized protein (DUF885 family)
MTSTRFVLTLTLTCCFVLQAQPAQKLHALFDEDWQWGLKESPEGATLYGDHRYDNRLTDLSPEAIESRKAHQREMLARIQAIDRSALDAQDKVSYDLFLRDAKLDVEEQKFPVEYLALSQMAGLQIDFGQLVTNSPFENAKDYANYLARLAAFPKQVDQTIALLKRGLESGWVQPAVPLRSVPGQIEGQLSSDATESPLYKPFQNTPRELPAATRDRLAADGKQAIATQVMPAMRKLDAFLKDTYLPRARKQISASTFPDGVEYYQDRIRRETTTNLTPAEIHKIGLSEVARIHKEMEDVVRETGFKGSFAEFLTYLRTDPRFYYTNADDLVAGYALIAKQIDGHLPELFAELPREPYGIRVIPAYEGPAQTTAYYQQGASDGSRAGMYMINTYKLDTRPKYEMEALTLHESVPGHHLQIARGQELKGLPEFRRNGGYTAFVEGWALYAESLGSEIGMYKDPYSRFGQLTYEMWRACRLVVDTGMHSLGWTRQQAIDFMKDNTAKAENDIVVEVDRYIVWPGQALAYKLGELKIKELRARAKAQLGDKFDLRKFHNAIIDNGALPLDVLDQQINEWIETQKTAKPHSAG